MTVLQKYVLISGPLNSSSFRGKLQVFIQLAPGHCLKHIQVESQLKFLTLFSPFIRAIKHYCTNVSSDLRSIH